MSSFSRGPGFARSAAYVSRPDVRMVSGSDLLHGYAMVHILELMNAGADRQAASTAGWLLDATVLLPLILIKVRPRQRADYRGFRCLAFNAKRISRVLGQEWSEFLADGHLPMDWPRAKLTPDDIGQMQWLLECVRQVAEGGELLAAARRAHDGHLGRPRQRRKPIDPDWFAGQLDQTLTHVWYGLLQAKWLAWALWLQDPPPDDQRPVAHL